MTSLILIRGLPGSGKSTFAMEFAHECTRLEADMYFIDHLGVYNWRPTSVADAHEWCIETACNLLSSGQSVVVSNTFTRLKEMTSYFRHAKLLGIDVAVYRMTGNYGSIHNVPEDVIKKMSDRFEDYPGEVLVGDK